MSGTEGDRRHHGGSGAAEWLLALVFFPMGLLVLILSTIPMTYDSLDVYRWRVVPAELLSVDYEEGSETTHRRYRVEYRYQWQGEEYTAYRFHLMGSVSLAKIDRQNHEIHLRLTKAMESGETITAWVNPTNPSRAVIDRSFHWQKLLFMWFISLLCCLIGFYGLRSLFHSGTAPAGVAPWLANPKWRDNVIYCGARSGMSFIWIITIILLVIGVLPMTSSGGTTTDEIRLLTVFPYNILVVACAGAAIKATWQWWRYGASPLRLDPFPGSIGGDVGGEIHFRLPYSHGIKAEVQLTATQKDDTGDSKNFKTTMVWQEDGYARVFEKGGGIALQFRFAVPEGLPESDISYERRRFARRHYEWTLRVTVITPQEEITRTYEVPVYPTGERTSTIEVDTLQENPFANSHHAAHQILPVVRHQGAETTLKFPMRGITTGMLLFLWLGLGLTFVGGIIVFSSSADNIARIQSAIYLAAGLALLGRTIYRHFNALQVQFTGHIVASERLLLGIPLRSRFVSYFDIKDIAFKLAPRSKRSDSAQAEHTVYAITEKGNITLAERIEGRRKAELVAEHLRKLIAPDGLVDS